MFETFTQSWESMALLEKIYWCFAIPFSIVFIIQVILTVFGSDLHGIEADGDVDATIEHDQGIDFQFLSLKNIIAFFTIFGWTGIICVDLGVAPWATVLISTLCGLTMMFIMASIMYLMGKLTENGTFQMKSAIGKIGTVYLSIPAKRNGMGQIQINVQGFRTIDAITDHEEDISTGAIVEVIDVINNDILLVKINK